MTHDDVIRWARETGLIVDSPYLMPHDHVMHGIERFAQAAYDAGAAAERAEVERLKALCEEMLSELYVYRASEYLKDVTDAIRARSNT